MRICIRTICCYRSKPLKANKLECKKIICKFRFIDIVMLKRYLRHNVVQVSVRPGKSGVLALMRRSVTAEMTCEKKLDPHYRGYNYSLRSVARFCLISHTLDCPLPRFFAFLRSRILSPIARTSRTRCAQPAAKNRRAINSRAIIGTAILSKLSVKLSA